jgi:hypothetical protein
MKWGMCNREKDIGTKMPQKSRGRLYRLRRWVCKSLLAFWKFEFLHVFAPKERNNDNRRLTPAVIDFAPLQGDGNSEAKNLLAGWQTGSPLPFVSQKGRMMEVVLCSFLYHCS